MSRAGLKVARAHGRELPGFGNSAAAEKELFGERDRWLLAIGRLAENSGGAFVADFTPDSLRGLEQWYFAPVSPKVFLR